MVQEQVKIGGLNAMDGVAAATGIGVLIDWVPVAVGLVTIIWLALRIWVLVDERITKIRGKRGSL